MKRARMVKNMEMAVPTREAVKWSGTPVRSHWVMNLFRVEWKTELPPEIRTLT